MSFLSSENAYRQELVSSSVEHMKRRHDAKSLMGIATSLHDLDVMIDGLQTSQVIFIGGRPSMGKSALTLDIVYRIAIELHLPTAIFETRYSNDVIVQRLIARGAEVDLSLLRSGRAGDAAWCRINGQADALKTAPIFFSDDKRNLADIGSRCRELKRSEQGLRLVVIEDLQGLKECLYPDEEDKVGEKLKALATELDITIIATSDITRSTEGRRNKRPLLSDLEVGARDGRGADIVLMLYRDEYYNPECKTPGRAEVIIRKNKKGPLGTVDLLYMGSMSRFSNPVVMEYEMHDE